jgi:hypothetical protein
MFTARPHSRNLGVVQITSRGKDEQAAAAVTALCATRSRSAWSGSRRTPPDPIHWADSPWSVPRLRGRGEQGVIVM